jgi:lipopolysaccharide export system protein LptC
MKLNFKLLTMVFWAMFISLGHFGGWWDEITTGLFSKKTIQVSRPRPEPPAILIAQPKLIGWEDYKKSWEIEAAKIWQSSSGSQYHFKNISNGVAYSVKDKRVDFIAGWARLERNRSELYLGGGLEAKIDEARIKTTESMINYKQEEMVCPKEVVYQKNDTIIKARKMIIRLKKDEILLEGDVRFFEKKDQMKADGLLYNTKEKKYYLITPKEIILYP